MLFLFFNFITSEIFSQDIDHKNSSFGNKFNQRYSILKTTDGHSSIIIVYICGMSSLEVCQESLDPSTIKQIAEATKSNIYCIEHRFFGKSLPFPDLSLESLQYFSIDQVIDDIGNFVSFLKNAKCHDMHCRFLLVGDGYGGSIAVWAKQQYPELIDSVWAISAPLSASNNYDSKEIFYSKYLEEQMPDCMGNISINMKKISDLFFLGNTTYIDYFYKYFSLTNETFPIEKNVLYAVSNFIYELIDLYISSDREPLDKYCLNLNSNNFLQNTKSALDNLSKTLLDYNPTWETHPVDEKMRKKHLESYLYCMELGWIAVSTPLYYIKRILPFSINSNYVSDNICQVLFDTPFKNRDYFNDRHGGRTTGVKSVIYTNAIKGPYQNLLYNQDDKILNDRNEIIKLSFPDLISTPNEPIGVDDSDLLKAVRNTVINTLEEWLTIDNKCLNGHVSLHSCVCDNEYSGKYCESLSRTEEYRVLSTLSVAIPTFMMLSIGIIAWLVFVVSSKTTKLIC